MAPGAAILTAVRTMGARGLVFRVSVCAALLGATASAHADLGSARLIESARRPTAARGALLHSQRHARRDGLTRSERRRLLMGDTVAHPVAFERRAAHYVGGVSYQLVRASPRAVLSALEDPRQLPFMLPHTRSARRLGRTGRDVRIELTQGNGLVSATYTVRARRVEGRRELRFWLDRSRPHGIEDVWGYFRVQAFDGARSLVTVAVALDLGPGLARILFEGRIQNAILGTPARIRDFIEPRALAFSG